MQAIEQNQGEIKLTLDGTLTGNQSLSNVGFSDFQVFDNGRIRLVVDMDQVQDPAFFHNPTFEFEYKDKMQESHWQVDFNGVTIADKIDHQGHKTLFLLNKDKLEELWQHHENRLVFHAEFKEAVTLSGKDSNFNLLK